MKVLNQNQNYLTFIPMRSKCFYEPLFMKRKYVLSIFLIHNGKKLLTSHNILKLLLQNTKEHLKMTMTKTENKFW